MKLFAEKRTPRFKQSDHKWLKCSDAVEQHMLYLATERGLSESYQLSTRRVLEDFAQWVNASEGLFSPRYIRRVHLVDYLVIQKARGLAPSSMKAIVVALKIFFRFLKERGLANQDPAEHIRLPRVPGHLPNTLNKLQMETLLSADLSLRAFPLRDQAIIELLYASGLRISELTSARLENLSLPERLIRVVGKGSKTRLVPIGKPACAAIERYIGQERIRLTRNGANEIFLSQGGIGLSTQRAWQIVKEIAVLAGFNANVYPHLFRHSFATHLLANGADLRVIQELLGHADIATTQVYTHVDISQLKELVNRCHPRAH
jgi:integrase/recombinase XerD